MFALLALVFFLVAFILGLPGISWTALGLVFLAAALAFGELVPLPWRSRA